VQEVVKRFGSAGLSWPLPEDLDEDALYARLYPALPVAVSAEPDFAVLSKELSRKGVTRTLLWREYAEAGGRLQYAQFCARFAAFERRSDPVMRLTHAPGSRLFVDYAGLTMAVMDRRTGEVAWAQVFVAALG
jgi:transposase